MDNKTAINFETLSCFLLIISGFQSKIHKSANLQATLKRV